MQHDWVNGQRPSQDPWPAIGASDRTRFEHIRSACPDWQNGYTLCTPVPTNPMHHDINQSTCVPAYIAILVGDGKQMQSLHHLCAPRRDVHHYAPEESMPVVTSSCCTHWQVLALIDTHLHIVSLILCAGTIFSCCNSSCIDVSNIVI